MANGEDQNEEITIRDLYPHFTDEQLKEAEENFKRYIELSIQMYRRIQGDPEAYAQFKALTEQDGGHTIRIAKPDPTATHQPPPDL